jgi:hypothetical protein
VELWGVHSTTVSMVGDWAGHRLFSQEMDLNTLYYLVRMVLEPAWLEWDLKCKISLSLLTLLI